MNELVRNVLMGAAGAADDSTFVDDVFSTYLYRGTGNQMVINNGIDLSEGGLVWMKNRDTSYSHFLFDTERGATKKLSSNSTSSEGTETAGVNAFNSNGFSIGTNGTNDGAFNHTSYDYASWTFRKAPGFFDIQTWSGNDTAGRQIPHNLGSVPGCIMVKKTSGSENWEVYHRGTDATAPQNYRLRLNSNSARLGTLWNDTAPTATHFTLSSANNVNGSGDTYIAYIFAGGESTADTARSVNFDGSGDYLSLAASTDFAFGTGDFTIECWVKPSTTSNPDGVFNLSSTTGGLTTAYNLSMAHQGSSGDNRWRISYGAGTQLAQGSTEPVTVGQWYHLAYVRASGVSKLYVNGTVKISVSDTTDYSYQNLAIGGYYSTSYLWKGDISNFRIVKGTALYTSSFKPTYEPLTNITNTKLLCCNNASVTGSTVAPSSTNTYSINVTASSSSAYTLSGNDRNGSVSGNNVTVTVNVGDTLNFAVNASGHPFYIRDSNGGYNVSTPAATNQGSQSGTVSWTPNTAGSFVYQCGNHSGMIGTITVNAASGSITANGNPTASTDSPFDDPEGFKFGKEGDQNIIKCGSYDGNGTTQHIDIGFEAQWVLIKNIDTARNWVIADSMRGAANNPFSNAERALFPNDTSDEVPGNYVGMYERGFRLLGGENSSNTSGDTYVYMAFRRPDGYVGKPPELGTDVFNMPLGLTDGTKPAFNTGFPVDFLIYKKPAVSGDWFTGARSIGINYLETNDTAAQATNSNIQWDFQDGMGDWSSLSSGYQSWSWKRHAGFDVVTYEGNGVIGRQMPHSLGVTPEMIWVKRRNANEHWYVYHKGVNGGTNPGDYMLYLDDWTVQIDHDQAWNNSLPTSTHFILGNDTAVNSGGTTQYMAMLFASVDGISKVGSYTGSTSTVTVTTGFSPRFVIIKRTDVNDEWVVLDTVRGWGSGNDPFLYINHSSAQNSNINLGAPTSTGFTVTTDYNTVNTNGGNFIYYAHA